MTGFGKSHLVKKEREYQMEIKSVNHRYLDISIKMPKQLSYLEEDIKKAISAKVMRGKLEVFVTFNNQSVEEQEIMINKEMAKLYIKQIEELAQETNLPVNINVMDMIKLPDVLNIISKQEDETIQEELLEVTNEAVEKLVEMRTFEGQKMAEDLIKRIEGIQEKMIKISSVSTGLIEEYVVKLEKRIKEILKTEEIDQNRLAQEVVIYADKCSIEEEVTRLKSHIAQFKTLILEERQGAIGKKLDFMIQEMNREINTIGSKANSLEIINNVVDIKTELENIREQIQNIE